MQTLYAIREYPDLIMEIDDAITDTPERDGMPRSSETSKFQERYMLRLERKIEKRDSIERALNVIPEVYWEPILHNIIYSDPYPIWADRSTFGRWKQRYVYEVAKELKIL